MQRRKFLTGFVLFSLALLIAACEDGDASKRYPDYRYRLAVEVETPEGLKTGSSVIEVSTMLSGKYAIPTPHQVFARAKGEAVTVDLGKRGTLFALLRSELSVDWANGALGLAIPPMTSAQLKQALDSKRKGGKDETSFDARMEKLYRLKGPYELPRHYSNVMDKPNASNLPDAYPMLVTFKNLSDPKSVTKVDPDNLAATFGEGVKLKRITVERTEDPVTRGIEKKLPRTFWQSWAQIHKTEMHRNGGVMKNPYFDTLAGELSRNDFSVGEQE